MNYHYFIRFGFGLLFSLWLATGAYFGTAGYTKLKIDELINLGKTKTDSKPVLRGKISFKNSFYLAAYEEELKASKFFPGIFLSTPNILVLLITACSFGILGALTYLTKEIAINNATIESMKVISVPMLGALTGIIMSGLATLVPSILVSGETELKPLSLVFLCFFGGLYNSRFFAWLNDTIGNLFPSRESTPS